MSPAPKSCSKPFKCLGFLFVLAVACLGFSSIYVKELSALRFAIQNSMVWNFTGNNILTFDGKSPVTPQWIVVVAEDRASPSPSVKSLQGGSQGWAVVVIGTPRALQHWRRLAHCVLLDGYATDVTSHTPPGILRANPYHPEVRSLWRKRAVLHAIQHGAKVIYELEDGTTLANQMEGFLTSEKTSGLVSEASNFFHPTLHFGSTKSSPSVCQHIEVGQQNVRSTYNFHKDLTTPAVQQGMNQPPINQAYLDVISGFHVSPNDTTFDPCAPPVIVPSNKFSFFSTQNTVFLYPAFWAMLLLPPVETSGDGLGTVTTTGAPHQGKHGNDGSTTASAIASPQNVMWLNFFTQRLLWEMGETLGFVSHDVGRKENDVKKTQGLDEAMFYSKIGGQMECIRYLQCPKWKRFFQCIEDLALQMEKRCGISLNMDANTTSAWMRDLLSIGYKEPARVDFSRTITSADKITLLFAPSSWYRDFKTSDPLSQKRQHGLLLNAICPNDQSGPLLKSLQSKSPPKKVTFFQDILLLVIFNHPHFSNTKYIEAAFRPLFANIVYCGTGSREFQRQAKDLKFLPTFLDFPSYKGYYGYMCMTRVLQMGFRVRGYFQMGDDNLVNVWNLMTLDKDILWRDQDWILLDANNPKNQWSWWQTQWGRNPFWAAIRDLNTTTRHVTGTKGQGGPGGLSHHDFIAKINVTTEIQRGMSDVFYIPDCLKEDAVYYFEMFYKHRLFLEITVPITLSGVCPPQGKMVKLKSANVWSNRNEAFQNFYKAEDLVHVHPVKLSVPKLVKSFCTRYLPDLLNYTYH